MPNNYVLLETIALTQSAASVTFDNLPTSGYTDLKIVMSGRLTTSGYDATPWVTGQIQLNGTAITSGKLLYGTGSAAGSDNNANAAFISDTHATANTFSSMDMYLPNYRSSNNKSVSIDVVTENNGTASLIGLQAILSTVAVPITSITFVSDGSGSFAANSTFSLYGIAALGTTPVTAPKATGGNIVANDGTYWYHAFTSSGYFVPQVGLTADVLVVAGGGGAAARGNRGAGGGGAGGLLLHTGQSLTTTTYNVTVGAGGPGSASSATSGVNSQFASLTASVGGGRGAADTGNGQTGGSGGGGWLDESGYASSASGQGFAGGAGSVFSVGANTYVAGGGGGASGAGNAGVTNGGAGGTNGKGGIGSAAYSSWGLATNTGQNVSGTYYYAGGGGGGSGNYGGATGYTSLGGEGGGGAGTGSTSGSGNGTPGTPNTGGGGGGANYGAGGAGGSGIIIIRYPIA